MNENKEEIIKHLRETISIQKERNNYLLEDLFETSFRLSFCFWGLVSSAAVNIVLVILLLKNNL